MIILDFIFNSEYHVELKELKPCPCCGSTASLHLFDANLDGVHDDFVVYCDKCSCGANEFKNRELAIQAWNKRSYLAQPARKIKGRSKYFRDKLKPCPFCGGKAVVRQIGWKDDGILPEFHVECRNCEAMTDFCSNKRNAVLMWNRRSFSTKAIRKSIREKYKHGRKKT